MDVFDVRGIEHIFYLWKATCDFLFQSSVPSPSALWYPSSLVKSHIFLGLAQKVNVLTMSLMKIWSRTIKDNTYMGKALNNLPPRFVATLSLISSIKLLPWPLCTSTNPSCCLPSVIISHAGKLLDILHVLNSEPVLLKPAATLGCHNLSLINKSSALIPFSIFMPSSITSRSTA